MIVIIIVFIIIDDKNFFRCAYAREAWRHEIYHHHILHADKQINGVPMLLLLLFLFSRGSRKLKKKTKKYLEDIKLIAVDVDCV